MKKILLPFLLLISSLVTGQIVSNNTIDVWNGGMSGGKHIVRIKNKSECAHHVEIKLANSLDARNKQFNAGATDTFHVFIPQNVVLQIRVMGEKCNNDGTVLEYVPTGLPVSRIIFLKPQKIRKL